MQPRDIANALAEDGNVHEISRGPNHIYRLYHPSGESTVLKVYGSPTYQRRERRALETLADLEGLPIVLEWGVSGETTWLHMEDAGRWTLGSLPGDEASARAVGAMLRRLHEHDPSGLSNLQGGMDSSWLAGDFTATFSRLQRYRRRLRIPESAFVKAADVAFPVAGEPRAAHTRPDPDAFVIDDDGRVTLTGWTWATLAPPVWDYTYAFWMLSRHSGAATGAFAEGYGASVTPETLRIWTAYHAASYLLRQAETRDGRLEDLQPVVDDLVASIK